MEPVLTAPGAKEALGERQVTTTRMHVTDPNPPPGREMHLKLKVPWRVCQPLVGLYE